MFSLLNHQGQDRRDVMTTSNSISPQWGMAARPALRRVAFTITGTKLSCRRHHLI